MADVFSKELRSKIMSRIRGKDTKPEKLTCSLLHRMGYRFRLHARNLPGMPDIVLPRHRKVVFVNGCFWHGHKACPRGRPPKSNFEFWSKKLAANARRDRLASNRLRREGWQVLTIWECETRNIEKVIVKLQKFMGF